jgi:8-oxo-dGTP diphosphatase
MDNCAQDGLPDGNAEAMRSSVNTIVIDSRQRYLLQMRDSNPGICHPLQWNFFGGGLDAGEQVLMGAMREIKEEIGVESSPADFNSLGVISEESQQIHVMRFMRSVERHQIVLNEGAGFGYFTIADLEKIDITPMTHTIIKRFLSHV